MYNFMNHSLRKLYWLTTILKTTGMHPHQCPLYIQPGSFWLYFHFPCFHCFSASWPSWIKLLSLSFPCFSYLFVLVFNTNNPPPISLSHTLSFLSLCLFSFPFLTSHPTTAAVLWLAEFQEGGGTMWLVVIFSCLLRTDLSVAEETGTDALSHSVLSVKQHCYAFKKTLL